MAAKDVKDMGLDKKMNGPANAAIKGERTVAPEDWRAMGLTDEEYDMICHRIGKHPNFLEVAMFSVMWSEHCSYKNSRKVLKLLPTKGECVLQGPGENAGIVDVGDGLAVAFKMESHNHPSAVEPYQGAATGSGGIIRDIFTMGARPIAILDPLFFGPTDDARNRHIIDGVVAGIAGYGNAVGIPTVGGMSWFGKCYSVNPLVNVMCVGYLKHDEIRRGKATGAGNKVMLIGSTTGRDGIHGATFASADLTEEAQERKSAVQVGDPFREKLLLEACLELVAKDLVLGIQDLGAAGLTCATSEMASRGGSGMRVELDLVPKRETGMNPYEIMLSESQERMLMVPVPGKEGEVTDILRKWDLDAAVIGEVTDCGTLTITMHGDVLAEVPADQLAESAPAYDREYVKPAYIDELGSFDPDTLPAPKDGELAGIIEKMAASANLCSKHWIYSQYDHQVGSGTDQTRRRRRRREDPRHEQGHSPYDGRESPLLLLVPEGGRKAGRGRSRKESGPYRREASRRNELPEPRQPHEAGSVLELQGIGAGPCGRVRGIRHAGDWRQRQLLQRGRRDRHIPDAHDRDGRLVG